MSEYARPGMIPLDFDGVFNTGSTEAYIDMINTTLDEVGVEADTDSKNEVIYRQWGAPPEKIMLSFIGDNPATIKRAIQLYREKYRNEFPDRVQGVEGSVEALQELRGHKYILALNTAANREILINSVMPRLGIDPVYFEGNIIAAEDIVDGLYKPDPYAIKILIKMNSHLGITTDNTLMVGDSASDVLSAYLAGVEVVVPLTGNLTREIAVKELEVWPEHVIESVAHLPEVAHQYLGAPV
jgi:phosphoglycolate phosphatase-like HAD superfamily hydrolase